MTRSLLLAAAALAGLSSPGDAAPRVVTDLPPVGALVAQVMRGVGAPAVLLTGGGDGHHHQLRPSEARQVTHADLLVWLGPQMTPWLGTAAEALAPGQGLSLLALPGTHLHDGHGHHHAEGADHDHAGDEAQGHDEGEGEDHPSDHGGIDPHAWLDPGNAQHWLGVIAEALAAQDPAHAEAYHANAAQGRAAIEAAMAEARSLLQGRESRRFVVSHDALGYFTEAMGLPPALALADLTDTAPSAGSLRRLRREIAGSGALCMYPEAGSDPRAFASLDGLGLQSGAPLDILGTSMGGEIGPDSYPALLVGLAQAIATCPAEN